MQYEDII
jgi:dynein heavy chain 1